MDSNKLLPPVCVAEPTAEIQRGRPFKPGQSGNPTGRPRGAKNRLSEILLSLVVDDFIEHGSEVIARLRQQDVETYLRFVASLVPRELILQREERPVVDYAELTDDEVVELIKEQRRRKVIELAMKSV